MPYGYDTSTGNSTAWVTWNDQWQTTATVSYTTGTFAVNDSTWYTWVQPTTSDTYTVDTTWAQWVVAADGYSAVTYSTPGPQLSDEEIAAERARVQIAADARMAERVEAVKKAKALLASLLDEKQREQLERQRFFDFVSQTGRRMRIKQGFSRNVDELGDDGRRLRTLCAHPGDTELVEEDHMVAQFLTLRHDEDAFFQRANVS